MSVSSEKNTALHLQGTQYYLHGNLSKAIASFKKILADDPKHTDAAISLSIIYNDIGKYDEAKRIYRSYYCNYFKRRFACGGNGIFLFGFSANY